MWDRQPAQCHSALDTFMILEGDYVFHECRHRRRVVANEGAVGLSPCLTVTVMHEGCASRGQKKQRPDSSIKAESGEQPDQGPAMFEPSTHGLTVAETA